MEGPIDIAIDKAFLDQLLAGREPQELFAKGGLVDDLKKALSGRMLVAELEDHLETEAEAGPDETTICKFRHLLEAKGLSKMMLTAVNDHLKSKGSKIGTGKIVDVTRISAPSSTKNEKGDPYAIRRNH
jgi:IS5 family transposase